MIDTVITIQSSDIDSRSQYFVICDMNGTPFA